MAAPRRRRDTDSDTDPPTPFVLRCDRCLSPDPQERTAHQLQLLKNYNIDVLRDHLTAQYVTQREGTQKRQDVVEAIMLWARNLVDQYSGMADPQTGAKMPWWQARQWLIDNRDQTAASAYAQAPEKYRQQNPPPGNLAPVVERVTAHIPQEPGDDDPLGI